MMLQSARNPVQHTPSWLNAVSHHGSVSVCQPTQIANQPSIQFFIVTALPLLVAQVLATLRLEVFRTLLMQKVSYFDKHGAAELTQLVSIELDTVRTFIFK